MTMTEVALGMVFLGPAIFGLLAWPTRGRVADGLAALAAIAILVPAAALALVALGGTSITAFGGIVALDAFGGWTLLVVTLVGLIAVAGSPAFLRHARQDGWLPPHGRGRYWALLLWFVGALLAVPLLDNLGLVWVAIEAATIVAALLVGLSRTPAAIEAAWKSLILGSVGIGFALLGTLLAYASSVSVLGATSDALAWTRLDAVASQLDPGLMRLAFIFVLVGYGTKTGLAPFHTWLPDAHSQAPSPVSALLSGAALVVSLYALARFQTITAGAVGPELPATILVAFGLLSLAVALPFIVAQNDVKRLLAYSSIEHMGLAALALGFGGTLALGGLTLHLLAHGLTKGSLFLSGGGLVEAGGSRQYPPPRRQYPARASRWLGVPDGRVAAVRITTVGTVRERAGHRAGWLPAGMGSRGRSGGTAAGPDRDRLPVPCRPRLMGPAGARYRRSHGRRARRRCGSSRRTVTCRARVRGPGW